jgi:hypothetical protein
LAAKQAAKGTCRPVADGGERRLLGKLINDESLTPAMSAIRRSDSPMLCVLTSARKGWLGRVPLADGFVDALDMEATPRRNAQRDCTMDSGEAH